ncbi:hypothetical protein EWH99_07185 [Sporolactobacillus sp. THM7-7]|nr:hypothetical protein EWH99_07185 [Sporolactobacillus sp. THM7-7]
MFLNHHFSIMDRMEQKIDRLDQRIDRIEQRADKMKKDFLSRFSSLEEKIDDPYDDLCVRINLYRKDFENTRVSVERTMRKAGLQ